MQYKGWRVMKAVAQKAEELPFIPRKGQYISASNFDAKTKHTEARGALKLPELLGQLRNPTLICDDPDQLNLITEARGIGTAATRHEMQDKVISVVTTSRTMTAEYPQPRRKWRT